MVFRKICTQAHKMLLSKSLRHSTSPLFPVTLKFVIKLKCSKGPQPILVKFLSHQTKTKLRMNQAQECEDPFEDCRIFILENLTTYRRELVAEASRRRGDGTPLSIWTLNGKIFVKMSPEGTPQNFILSSILLASRLI